jgi:hypothetical protein
MPNVYKLKTCPCCGKEHRRRGPYCGRSCANKSRVITDEHKRKIADGNRKHMASDKPTAQQSKWLITQQRKGDGKTAEQLEWETNEWMVSGPAWDPGVKYEVDSNGDIWM